MNEKPSSSDILPVTKSGLRRLIEVRRASALSQNPHASLALRDCFLKKMALQPGHIIASYSAYGSEINPEPVVEYLRKEGHIIVLPVMMGRYQPLLFRQYDGVTPLIRNAVGIYEPNSEAPLLEPDVILVPLMAFDRHHHRLGTGGGYYDRTLECLRKTRSILTVGLAFSCQELPEIPIESHDIPLDRIATEIEVF